MGKREKGLANVAYNILSQRRKPMSYTEITDEAIRINALKTKSKTPWQSLRVAMARDNRFVRLEKGIYGLIEW